MLPVASTVIPYGLGHKTWLMRLKRLAVPAGVIFVTVSDC